MKTVGDLIAIAAFACLSQMVDATELLKTESSWDGNAFAYPEGPPEVTSIILALDPGEQTPWHCHPVPTLGYVVRGSLEVETQSGKKILLKAGDSVVEVMRTLHRGTGLSDGVEIVVFYAGDTEIPNTLLEKDSESAAYCISDSHP